MSKWHKVKSELPKINESVLLFWYGKRIIGYLGEYNLWYASDDIVYLEGEDKFDAELQKVTHWHKLPELPEDEIQ